MQEHVVFGILNQIPMYFEQRFLPLENICEANDLI